MKPLDDEPEQPLVLMGREATMGGKRPASGRRAGGLRRLDLQTPLERGLTLSAIGAFIFAVVGLDTRAPLPPEAVAGLAAVGAVSLLLRASTDCTYLVDEGTRELFYSRTFLGSTTQWRVAGFDDLAAVTVEGLRYHGQFYCHWKYAVVLVTRQGDVIPVSDPVARPGTANRAAQDLAAELGVGACVACPEEQELTVRSDAPGHVVVAHAPWSPLHGTWRAAFALLLALTAVAPMLSADPLRLMGGVGAAGLHLYVLWILLAFSPRLAALEYFAWFVFVGVVAAPGSFGAVGVGMLAFMLLAFFC